MKKRIHPLYGPVDDVEPQGHVLKKIHIISDLPAYKSPIDGKTVDGRTARREDLKRNNCREVDPTEIRHSYSEEFARKKGLPPPEKEFKHLFR